MISSLQSDLELMQSLLTTVLDKNQLLPVPERILALETARRDLQYRLTAMMPNQRQEQALEIMRNQACMEFFYTRRSQAILHSELEPEVKKALLMGLSTRYHQARQRLDAQWPALTASESESLPVLLLRQSIEQDIDSTLLKLRKQYYFPRIA